MSEKKVDVGGTSNIPHWYDPKDDRDGMAIVDAEGARITDDEGRTYLDFVSSLYCVNAGHDNEAIADAMADQLSRVAYVSPAKGNDTREALAGRIAEVAPGSLSNVIFSVSGSEANEIAVQLARKYTDAPKILTRWRSYHGSTYGAGSLTGSPGTRNAIESHAATTGAEKFLPPVSYQSPFDADTPEELATQAADHLEYVIRHEGPDSVAAVLTEPVAGGSGAYTAPPGYFERVREICDAYDVLLMVDEVVTGFGRCGDWFGSETEGIEPDLISFAKGVTGGYAPLGGVVTRPEIESFVREEGFGMGQTFGGHPVACAAGLAAMEQYADGLIDNVTALEPVLAERLHDLAAEHHAVDDVRGRGFHWGLAFADPDTGEPVYDDVADDDEDNPVEAIAEEARERGVLFSVGRPGWQLLMCPPLSIDAEDIEEATAVLDASIEAVLG